MKRISDATENDMVLAFVQAEIDAPRWAQAYASALANRGLTRSLVQEPDLRNAQENVARKALLGDVRGYPGRFLFQGFPVHISWRRVVLEKADHDRLRYANLARVGPPSEFFQLANRTRDVRLAASNVYRLDNEASRGVRGVLSDMAAGKKYPPLIAVEGQGDELVLVEGHTRATAYVNACVEAAEALVGSSPAMWNWFFF